MPLRTITMPDGREVSMMIRNYHPDGTEFLPEEFTITGDTPEGRRAIELAVGLVKAGMEREALEKAANENKDK